MARALPTMRGRWRSNCRGQASGPVSARTAARRTPSGPRRRCRPPGPGSCRAGGDPLDRDDDRHRQLAPGADHRIEPSRRLASTLCLASGPRNEEGAAAELARRRASTTARTAASPPICAGDRGQFPDEHRIQGIEPLGSVQRHMWARPAAPFEQQCLRRAYRQHNLCIVGVGMALRSRIACVWDLDQSPPPPLQRGLAGALLVSAETRCWSARRRCDPRRGPRRWLADRLVFFIDRSFSWDELRNETQSLSLFSERRLLELRLPTGKPDKGAALLAELAANPPPDVITLVVTEKLDRKAGDAAWVQAFAQHGVWLPVRSVGEAELPAWLAARAARAGFALDEAAAQLIAERTEGNLLAAAPGADEARAARGGRTHRRRPGAAVGGRQRALRRDAGVRGRGAGDAARAAAHPARLKSEGVEPTLDPVGAGARSARPVAGARTRSACAPARRQRLEPGQHAVGRALSRLRSLPLAGAARAGRRCRPHRQGHGAPATPGPRCSDSRRRWPALCNRGAFQAG